MDAQLDEGKLALKADATRLGAKPAVRFALDAATLDIDKLMPSTAGSTGAKPRASDSSGKTADKAAAGVPQGEEGVASSAAGASGTAAGAKPATGSPPRDGARQRDRGGRRARRYAGRPGRPGRPGRLCPPLPPSAATGASPSPSGDRDLSALVGPTAQGTLKAGRLVVQGVTLQSVSATLKLAKGKLDVSPWRPPSTTASWRAI